MIVLRKAEERGHFDHGWLETYHTFSFAEYDDPAHRGFRTLRVINEDRVQPGEGFGTHPHRDMEIITYVLEGSLAHKDSMGNGSIIRPGDVQRMSAGTGVTHSEYNPSQKEPVHLLQIWILPSAKGLAPSYEQKSYPDEKKRGQFCLIASQKGREDSLTIHQDADVYAAALGAGGNITHPLRPGRHAWLQAARGSITVKGLLLQEGDGAAIRDEVLLTMEGKKQSEMLFFDLV